jgi:hypothetical protein
MTEYLIASRAAIIFWTSLAVLPAEILFDAIETELERRGVELWGSLLGPAADAGEKDPWSSK